MYDDDEEPFWAPFVTIALILYFAFCLIVFNLESFQ